MELQCLLACLVQWWQKLQSDSLAVSWSRVLEQLLWKGAVGEFGEMPTLLRVEKENYSELGRKTNLWMPAFAEQNELSGPRQILQQPVFGREINRLFNSKKHCYCLHVNKSNSYLETFAIFCFLSEKINLQSENNHWSTNTLRIISLSASLFGTSRSYLDKN